MLRGRIAGRRSIRVHTPLRSAQQRAEARQRRRAHARQLLLLELLLMLQSIGQDLLILLGLVQWRTDSWYVIRAWQHLIHACLVFDNVIK